MGVGIYAITVQGEAPALHVGAEIGGAKVISIKDISPQLVSAAYLSKQYNLDVKTIRSRLLPINKGTPNKHLYNPEEAERILSLGKQKTGRKRVN
ncbi:hypothetical protein [Acinetobacter larvae]|uniref:Uncharacterized protein n=1 Tax=Acinetobacter larvae TaxID=1789224 RepID=A0A1B2LZ82_9GAMM|nr:hypothetical protein [Acinetobacter larvae]AOA58245.1 hypothetical protein BFG52_07680 [Acinetobacter larvae]